jgi:hypothetical protein
MKLMKTQPIPDEDTEPRSRVARRRFLGVVGGGGLATAATVFGFASPASATVAYGCCNLCCNPKGKTLAQCETGFHYVWQCTESTGGTCTCCEHQSPCSNGCHGAHYSVYTCT